MASDGNVITVTLQVPDEKTAAMFRGLSGFIQTARVSKQSGEFLVKGNLNMGGLTSCTLQEPPTTPPKILVSSR